LLAFSAARGARIARRRRGPASGIKVQVFHEQYSGETIWLFEGPYSNFLEKTRNSIGFSD